MATSVRKTSAGFRGPGLCCRCRACPGVEGKPVCGAVRGSRILLVGQAPGPRELVDLFPLMAPDPATQRLILVDNPARLYGF